ncbi:amino acid permease [Mycobacterium decipiens]|uniref:Amino acid permease n=1 Tax=Mycobacterium decipiens TaxID=1430326 RepID=A0A1X2LVA0_9MYCO|nr:amino acid permease [Mycobacterium decipiens]OSC40331.1 amino acid permease [Mycobacterium decipiens]
MSILDFSTSGVFRRKPIDAIEPEDPQQGGGLLRVLGLWQLVALGVGGIIGAGVFSLAGAVAKEAAGPGVPLSFVVAGIASACAALSYAEFAGMIPKGGSAYTYSYAVLGEAVGWFVGWDLLLEYTAIVAVVGIGISGYFGFLVQQVGISLPQWTLGAPGTGQGHVVDLFAMLLCLLIAFVLTRGVRNAARAESVLVWLKVGLVVLIICLGAFYVNTDNYTPFLPFGWNGVLFGASIVFFAVFGYDAMSTAAEESAQARKMLPKAILISLTISMTLYILACLVLTGMIKYTEIDPTSAFARAFDVVGLPGIATLISVGAVIGIATVMFTFMFAVTRVWFSMARDGLLPRWFAAVDTKHHVPVRVTWIVGIVSALIAGFTPIVEAAQLTNIGILLAFAIVCSSVIVLRYRSPDIERSFRMPGMPIIPLVGVGASIWLTIYLTELTWLRFTGWLLLGLAIYAFYGHRNSHLNPSSPHRANGVQPLQTGNDTSRVARSRKA